MNVCESLLDILSGYGVRHIFGIPGDAINELIEAIRKQDKIKFIHVMHEEAGAFAASAQAKLTGGLGVCCGTAGPGAIHLLNGLYDAKMDHAPVLAITGQVKTALIGSTYHQEVDLHALFENVAVYNQTIINAEQMPGLAVRACESALSLKGVAHINIPGDISTQLVKNHHAASGRAKNNAVVVPCTADLKLAAELIDASERPCILAGIGAREARSELLRFAEYINAPIIKSLRGKDLLADNHPFTLGGLGLLGTEPSLNAIHHCDLLIAVGTDFPYHDFYPNGKIPSIQIDLEAHHIGRRHGVSNPLVGDAAPTLEELMLLITERENGAFLKECQSRMQKWLNEQHVKEHSPDTPIHPQTLARMVSDLADEHAIVCCDTGAVTVWGARNFRIKEQQRFTLSGGLASMGYGLPAAIGAQVEYPDRQVIALCGDGGFAMLMADFASAVKYQLPVKIFIFNNSKLGLIQMEEEASSGNPESETELHNPDYALFARACGGEGFNVENPTDLESVIARALESPGPSIVNVFVDAGELVLPPEVSTVQAVNYVKAKVKEYFLN
jgi:thiamine pyrophosphate-dependent acetolactate synthase large subunit-like protein